MESARSLNLQPIVAGLTGVAAALGVGLVLALNRESEAGVDLTAALASPGIRGAVVDRIVADVGGTWDTHPDPDIGHMLLPKLKGRKMWDITVDSNRFGMREKEYELPKPEGMLRVVLLGDSYIFGSGIEAEKRLGYLLEKQLGERARAEHGAIEVLHIGLMSWNIHSECSYLRRQLDLMQPDLVIHITVANDLDDVAGARGFGGMGAYSERHRARADTLIQTRFAWQALGMKGSSALNVGVDHESRERFREASSEIGRLARALADRGAEYILTLSWSRNDVALRELGRELDPAQVVVLSHDFSSDRQYWVAPNNRHWNQRGMEVLSEFYYGVIQSRGYLAQLDLEPWPEANARFDEIHLPGMAKIEGRAANISLPRLDEKAILLGDSADEAIHFHGGVDREGRVSPYASIALRNTPGGRLVLTGSCLGRTELDGSRVQVSIDDVPTGSFELQAGRELNESWPIPPEVEREFVTVRFRAEDFVYVGEDLRRCAVFRLQQVETMR